MSVKVGETPILRGSPPVIRTLEVLVDDDWLVSDKLEKCVSFREASLQSGRVVIVFSRSISAEEARAFASLLVAAADVLDQAGSGSGPEDPR